MDKVTDKKVVIITGAAHGIGQEAAARFCRNGYKVGLVDIDQTAVAATAKSLNDRGYIALPLVADVADEAELSGAVAESAARLGPASIVVSNAGFARDMPLDDMSLEDWDSIQSVHLRALFLLTRMHLPHMKEQGWGRVVAISSISANGHANRANYCAAKSGIEGFVRSAAVELGPYGITANAIAPGLIVTKMTEATASRRGLSLDAHLENAHLAIPVRRTGKAEDIAHAIAFFASEESGFITGQVLAVSGGVIV